MYTVFIRHVWKYTRTCYKNTHQDVFFLSQIKKCSRILLNYKAFSFTFRLLRQTEAHRQWLDQLSARMFTHSAEHI